LFEKASNCTPLKFNIAPEKWWLEDYFPLGKVTMVYKLQGITTRVFSFEKTTAQNAQNLPVKPHPLFDVG